MACASVRNICWCEGNHSSVGCNSATKKIHQLQSVSGCFLDVQLCNTKIISLVVLIGLLSGVNMSHVVLVVAK